jgi:hypothetical protein
LQTLFNSAALLECPVILASLDIEAWEHCHSKVTEVGLAWMPASTLWDGGCSLSVASRHYILEENLEYRNGMFVDDAKFDFNFGTSKVLQSDKLSGEVADILRDLREQGQVFLVGHSVHHDIKWMEGLGVDILEAVCGVVDIGLADKIHRKAKQVMGLENMLVTHAIPFSHLHNAGNDAVYTLEAVARLLKVCGMEVLEAREQQLGWGL